MIIQNVALFNIMLLSFSFLLIYTALGTTNYIQKVMVNSVNRQNKSVHWNPFLSSCFLFVVRSDDMK